MAETVTLPQGRPAQANAMTVRARLGLSVAAGLAAGLAAGMGYGLASAPLVGWDAAALVFVLSVGLSLHGRDAQQTADLAVREDPGHAATDAILIAASLISLAAVGQLLAGGGGLGHVASIGFAAASVVMAWVLIHSLFMLRYAREYYQNGGGIDFGSEPPAYADFAYLAFTLGMTFQVSDTAFQVSRLRRIALRHVLLSYVFGTVIVAVIINLIAGLAK